MTPGIAPLPDPEFWRDRRVLVTGHTGFKGAWLALWLRELGAEVHGLALDPPTDPNAFELAAVRNVLASDTRADIRESAAVLRNFALVRPEVVFHMAAQSLVRSSYAAPAETFATNLMGTVHVLDAAVRTRGVRAAIVVTSDKCYESRGEGANRHRESDRLGGHDPYSSSKACAELATACWRSSFALTGGEPRLASVRAGNVIGAGDWGLDRLVPDCVRAFQRGEAVRLRFPQAVRPWQHVLEPLCGYLVLAEGLCRPKGADLAAAWNFGPDPDAEATVHEVASESARLWGGSARTELAPEASQPHETAILRLDSSAARTRLGWRPRWRLRRALEATIWGYRACAEGKGLGDCIRTQIADYCRTLVAPEIA